MVPTVSHHFYKHLICNVEFYSNFNVLLVAGVYGGGSWADIYVKPYCRVGAYSIGLLVGYLIVRCNRKLGLPIVSIH